MILLALSAGVTNACIVRTAKFLGRRTFFTLKWRCGLKKIAKVTQLEKLCDAQWDSFEKQALKKAINNLKSAEYELKIIKAFALGNTQRCKKKLYHAHAKVAFFEEDIKNL